MRSLALICVVVYALVGHATAYFELVPDSMGKKAYDMDISDATRYEQELRSNSNSKLVEQTLEVTKVTEGKEGCTWSHFTDLLDLLKKAKTHPVPQLIKIALARQFETCGNEVAELPAGDGLTPDERNRLTQFRSKVEGADINNLKSIAKATLMFLKEDLNLTFKHIKKHSGDKELEFNKIFYAEMDFCFKVDDKLHHYYEFVDQLSGPKVKLADKSPLIAERVGLGLACRAFVNNQQKIKELAFKKTMGKWYNMKKSISETINHQDDDD